MLAKAKENEIRQRLRMVDRRLHLLKRHKGKRYRVALEQWWADDLDGLEELVSTLEQATEEVDR